MADKIYVLDTGSIASKLLQHELKDQYHIDVVKATGADLVENFTKISNENRIKIFLPFSADDLVENHEQKRKEVGKVESLGFKNLIVLPYEGRDNQTIKELAKKAGIKEDIKLTGKPEAIAIDDSNEQFKPYKTFRTGTKKSL